VCGLPVLTASYRLLVLLGTRVTSIVQLRLIRQVGHGASSVGVVPILARRTTCGEGEFCPRVLSRFVDASPRPVPTANAE